MDLLAAFTAIARRRAQFPVAAGSRAFLICRSMDRIGLSGAYIRGYSVNELVPDSRSWAVDKPSPFRWCFVALGNKPQTRDALSDFRHMCGVRSHRILPSCCIATVQTKRNEAKGKTGVAIRRDVVLATRRVQIL
jgi:hypothetical protein